MENMAQNRGLREANRYLQSQGLSDVYKFDVSSDAIFGDKYVLKMRIGFSFNQIKSSESLDELVNYIKSNLQY